MSCRLSVVYPWGKGAAVSAMLLLFLASFVPAPKQTSQAIVVVRSSSGEAKQLEASIVAALRKQRLAVVARSDLQLSSSGAIRPIRSDSEAIQFASQNGASILILVKANNTKNTKNAKSTTMQPIRATPIIGIVHTVSWKIVRIGTTGQVEQKQHKVTGFGRTAAAAATDASNRVAQIVSAFTGRTLRARWPEEMRIVSDSGYVRVHLSGVRHWSVVSDISKSLKKSLGRSSVEVRSLDGRGEVWFRVQSQQTQAVKGIIRGISALRGSPSISIIQNTVHVRWAAGRDGA